MGRHGLALIVVVLAGLALRWPSAAATALDNDEFYTMEDSLLLLEPEAPEGARSFPLTFAVTRVAVELGGLTPVAMRAYPLLAGLLAILAVGLAGRSGLLAPRASLLAALLLAAWPWHQYFSGYARYYAPLFLFSTLAILMTWRARGDRRAGAFAGLWAVAATATHPTGILCLSGAAAPWLDPRRARRAGWRRLAAVGLAVGGAAAAVALTPYGAPLRSVLAGRVGHGADAVSLLLSLLNNVTLPIAALSAAGAVALLRDGRGRRRGAGRFLVASAALPVLAVAAAALIGQSQARYAMAAMPAVVLLAGAGLDAILSAASSPAARVALAAAAVAPSLPGLASNVIDGDRHDWSGAAASLRAGLEPGALVVAEEHGLVRAELYGYGVREREGRGDPPYPRALVEAPPDRAPLAAIDAHQSTGWFVIPENKLEAPPGRGYRDLIAWLRPRATVAARVGSRRLDYHRNVIAVLRVDGCAANAIPLDETGDRSGDDARSGAGAAGGGR